MTQTRKRVFPKESSPFGMWLREQPELDSHTEKLVCTSGFFIWQNYENGSWMLLQTKRKNTPLTRTQKELFATLHTAIQSHVYYGFYVVSFENTTPDDGKVLLNGKTQLTKEQFFKFLRFELPLAVYETRR